MNQKKMWARNLLFETTCGLLIGKKTLQNFVLDTLLLKMADKIDETKSEKSI